MADIQYLNDLLDVEVPSPANGDVLYWDAAAARWKSKQPPVGGGIVERQIRASIDDIDVRWNGAAWAANLTNEYWTCGYWQGNNVRKGGGGRFLNIYVLPGATITHAYFKPTARSTDNLPNVNTRLHGELNINPATFSTIADYLARERTAAVVDWDNIPPWTEGELYQSPDIKAIIQEIVNLDGWASGNPIVIFWDDHDDRSAHINYTVRRARSWNHALRTPPILYIEWTP